MVRAHSWRRMVAVSLAISTVAAMKVSAQVTVQEGEKVERIEYASPMTLEFPLTVLERLSEQKTAVQTEDLRRFVCDGVSISALMITATHQGDGARLQFEASVFNEPGYDKKVNVRGLVIAADKPLGYGQRKNIDAEEGKTRRRTFTFDTKPTDNPADAVLRLTVTVRPD